MRIMVTYPWPGNIRELRNAVEYAFVLAKGKSIGIEHLPDKLLAETSCVNVSYSVFGQHMESVAATGAIPVKQSEKAALVDALHQADGNQTQAAEILGVSRVTVWKRMKKHGITLKNQEK
jgi:two-component system, NtrC family, response regulator HydG